MLLSPQLPLNEGETRIRTILSSPRLHENPNSPFLVPQGVALLQSAPLLALGTLDAQGRPWTTLWGGETGFARQVAPSLVGVKTSVVDGKFDPVVEALFEGGNDGEVVRSEGEGKMVSGLTIDMERRRRVKLFGHMVAGALSPLTPANQDQQAAVAAAAAAAGKENMGQAEAQLVFKIDQSLTNCPKYITSLHITPIPSPAPPPTLISTSPSLHHTALSLIRQAHTLFISSTSSTTADMDCNIRGGPRGFIRILPQPTSSSGETKTNTQIAWPEYSGNTLYQTLGNLLLSPQAGLFIPDFRTSSALFLTGTAQVLHGADAATLLPHSNLAILFTVVAARMVGHAMPFCAENEEEGKSPYNPPVRYLASEKAPPSRPEAAGKGLRARVVGTEKLSATVHRHTLRFSRPLRREEGSWKPGDYVAISAREELDMGYIHMNDEDPGSLNDDYVRSFTISASPLMGDEGEVEGCEVMVRSVGPVTRWLAEERRGGMGKEVEVLGFGRGAEFSQGGGGKVGFVAAGIGITPLLGRRGEIEEKMKEGRVEVFWTVRGEDIGVVRDMVGRWPEVKGCLRVFVTGALEERGEEEVMRLGVRDVQRRRLVREDLIEVEGAEEWMVCTSPRMRTEVEAWLEGKKVVVEDFGY
ncbi:MAG: hypothetical protein Q9227_004998 [Pyrenula ochraceoflavens]